MRDQSGEEFYQESTGNVGFFLALLLADQWEAENPNFLVIWPSDKYEGSKWLNVYCQAQVQFQVTNPSPKSKSQIRVSYLSPKN